MKKAPAKSPPAIILEQMGEELRRSAQTECQVNYDIVGSKVRCQVAVGVREIGKGCAPVLSVDMVRCLLHILRDASISTRPEPDRDCGVGAFHRIPKIERDECVTQQVHVSSSTNHPPPAKLNPLAKLFALFVFTPHPELELTRASQLVLTVVLTIQLIPCVTRLQ